ncbi:hypothetical protein HPB49_013373 [Dermacentor silvarum]|uniref:Uncharacterized protein n=1 Tax=Dermacentor silvarum TaxID=543639 RepID=A0ACB8DDC9_DERSI|nr:hypothetical protein HPB49_013373 [Dermacentor silvarum]
MESVNEMVRNVMVLSCTLNHITFTAMYRTCSGITPRWSVHLISLLDTTNGVLRGAVIGASRRRTESGFAGPDGAPRDLTSAICLVRASSERRADG